MAPSPSSPPSPPSPDPPSRLAAVALSAFCGQCAMLCAADAASDSAPATLQVASVAVPALARVCLSRCGFSVAWRAALLGTGAAAALHLMASPSSALLSPLFGRYLLLLCGFHLTEYLATAWTNPGNLSTDSFLLNHSGAYHAAAVASWAEFALEAYLLPEWLAHRWFPILNAVSLTGVAVCLAGEALRKAAMAHAGTSFNHVVQVDVDGGGDSQRQPHPHHHQQQHKLVTSGVFALFRHPSYVGWFWWSVATQAVLCNPFCLVGYAFASWAFFYERVVFEEWTLLRAYGSQYAEYQRRVPTGLPFIRGYDQHKL